LNLLWIFLAVIAGVGVFGALRRESRRAILDRLRREWGVGLDRPFSSQVASEAWRELDYGSDPGVDEHTWTDLHLDEVLAHVDHSHTNLGTQNLYRRFRTGAQWASEPELEKLATRFGAEPRFREQVGLILARGGRSLGAGLWIITRPHLIHIQWWYWLFPVLSIAMFLSLVGAPFQPALLVVACGLAVVNMFIRGLTQWQVPGLLRPMGQMAPLIKAAESLSRLPGIVEPQPPDLIEDLRRLRPLRRIAGWVTRDTTPDESLGKSVAEWVNLLLLLDANALLFGAGYIRRYASVLKGIAQWIGDVDVSLGVASLRAQDRWCIPNWEEGSRLLGEGVWHPLIESAVENDIELIAGSGVVITGANASGKTTYVRAVGVAALLATALNTCPARSWTSRRFRVMSMIGGGDDLLGGRSYYQVEVDRIVVLLQAAEATTPTLFLLDELLRGTNTVDRLAAGEAILKKLVGCGIVPLHSVMIATHDLELTILLEEYYESWHFRETMTAAGPIFEYHRHPGPATSRTALALLKAAGASDELIRSAQFRAEELIERSRARVEVLDPGPN
jgi:hypothetical protein